MSGRRGGIARRRGRAWSVLVATASVLITVTTAPGATASGDPLASCVPAPARKGFSVVSARPAGKDGRLVDYTISSPAVNSYEKAQAGRLPHAYVLLPPDYRSAPGRRWPVLYLLHGHGGSYQDWVTRGDIEAAVDSSPLHGQLIVVMPDGGYDGFYTNWYGLDSDGHNGSPASGAAAPAWETFHIEDLIPWVNKTFRVEKGSVHVAIAGQSMGGFGAMSYTARHPGLFGTAGEFSGAVDTDLDWPVAPVAQEQVANLPDGKAADDCIWGDPVTQHQLWLSHDPTNLAARLRGVALYLASGTGAPDPNNPSSFTNPGGALTEAGIYQMNQGFLSALRQDGITPAAVNFYPFGVHDWPYWRADLAQFLRLLSTDGFRR